ncbi:MAG: DNA cytosine methyltransferase [Armatimonadia bacterium]|nr:DNA cytosine methyltransferase [Armatimonadia bacterium]
MAIRAPRSGLSLCSGIGGLELGLRLVWPELRTVCWVERDRYAAGVLAARMRAGALDEAPIWDDLASFNGRAWRGKVDLVSAGYPCQPFSVAGKRRGKEDDRHLWPHVARVISDVGPSIVVLENVSGHLRLGFDEVLGELTEMGYDATWGVVRASDAGLPHQRARLFVLAYPRCERDERRCGSSSSSGAPRVTQDAGDQWQRSRDASRDGGADVGDTDELGHQWSRPARQRWIGFAYTGPPGPSHRDAWECIASADPEALPAVEPDLCGVADGIPAPLVKSVRRRRLRCLGNAVVPAQAALAIRALIRSSES